MQKAITDAQTRLAEIDANIEALTVMVQCSDGESRCLDCIAAELSFHHRQDASTGFEPETVFGTRTCHHRERLSLCVNHAFGFCDGRSSGRCPRVHLPEFTGPAMAVWYPFLSEEALAHHHIVLAAPVARRVQVVPPSASAKGKKAKEFEAAFQPLDLYTQEELEAIEAERAAFLALLPPPSAMVEVVEVVDPFADFTLQMWKTNELAQSFPRPANPHKFIRDAREAFERYATCGTITHTVAAKSFKGKADVVEETVHSFRDDCLDFWAFFHGVPLTNDFRVVGQKDTALFAKLSGVAANCPEFFAQYLKAGVNRVKCEVSTTFYSWLRSNSNYPRAIDLIGDRYELLESAISYCAESGAAVNQEDFEAFITPVAVEKPASQESKEDFDEDHVVVVDDSVDEAVVEAAHKAAKQRNLLLGMVALETKVSKAAKAPKVAKAPKAVKAPKAEEVDTYVANPAHAGTSIDFVCIPFAKRTGSVCERNLAGTATYHPVNIGPFTKSDAKAVQAAYNTCVKGLRSKVQLRSSKIVSVWDDEEEEADENELNWVVQFPCPSLEVSQSEASRMTRDELDAKVLSNAVATSQLLSTLALAMCAIPAVSRQGRDFTVTVLNVYQRKQLFAMDEKKCDHKHKCQCSKNKLVAFDIPSSKSTASLKEVTLADGSVVEVSVTTSEFYDGKAEDSDDDEDDESEEDESEEDESEADESEDDEFDFEDI